jgi:acyl dehydratase
MAIRQIQGLEELRSLVGQSLGISDWFEVSQERVNMFADATGDHQWIHCDPERAKTESPFGTTVAHGFFTLALINTLMQQSFVVVGPKMMVNYGLNRVRFPAAVKVGSMVRMLTDLVEVKEFQGVAQVTTKHTFEIQGEKKPVCVAETVVRLYF